MRHMFELSNVALMLFVGVIFDVLSVTTLCLLFRPWYVCGVRGASGFRGRNQGDLSVRVYWLGFIKLTRN